MAGSKTSGRKVLAAERRATAVELRKAGLSFQKIGDHLGVSAPAVFKMVRKALGDLNTRTAETAEEVRRLELERLDEWQIRVTQEMKSGNVLPAIDRGLRIADRRARLLGLDAPRQAELSGRNGGPLEITGPQVVVLIPDNTRGDASPHRAESGVVDLEPAYLEGGEGAEDGP